VTLRPSPSVRLVGPLHPSPPRTITTQRAAATADRGECAPVDRPGRTCGEGVYPPPGRSVSSGRPRAPGTVWKAADIRLDQARRHNPQTGGTTHSAVIRCAALVSFR
jgi:hypothetical protein